MSAGTREGPAPPAAGWRSATWRHWLGTAFALLVLALLAWAARRVPWAEVGSSLQALPPTVLAGAAVPALLSHLIYSCYDLFGRAWTGHAVPRWLVFRITFISYAFNLNLGSLVGALALRLRLYAQEGLKQEQIVRILALSLTTNWLGYGLLGGGLFLLRLVAPPTDWRLGAAALQGLGGLLWLLVTGYLVLCARGRSLNWRSHRLVPPPLHMALAQLSLSNLNWMCMAAVVFVLLQGAVPYLQLLATLLVAAMAGVLVHVPAGLGVLEAVFIALLGQQVPTAYLLAALLAYRALYYLAPLLLASTMYFALEARRQTGAGRPIGRRPPC